MSEVRIEAEERTKFGKGGARQTRRDGKIPAVLYGHGHDPKHLSLAGHELTMALRKGGLNTLLTIVVDGEDQLALPKALQVHPLKRAIQHVDLLIVRQGEKVTVDIPVIVEGDVVSGGIVNQDVTTLSIEAEATHIPDSIIVSIEGLEIGAQINAGDVVLPTGSTLIGEPDALVLAIAAAATEAETSGEAGDAAAEAPAAE